MSHLVWLILFSLDFGTGRFSHCQGTTWDCSNRIESFVNLYTEVLTEEDEQNLTPELLAAISRIESQFNPLAISNTKDYTIMGLNSIFFGDLQVIKNSRYRKYCTKKYAHACQKEAIRQSLKLLQMFRRRCKTLPKTLSAYNTGSCGSKLGLQYSKNVLKWYTFYTTPY